MKGRSIIFGIIFVAILVFVLIFAQQNNSRISDEKGTVLTVQDEISENNEDLTKFAYHAVDKGEKSETFTYETDYYLVVFDTSGAGIRDLYLKEFEINNSDKKTEAENLYRNFIFHKSDKKIAFLSYWGDDFSNPILEPFSYSIDGGKVIFSKTFSKDDGSEFTLNKTYQFKDGEYLFAIDISFTGSVPTDGRYCYSLGFSPQVGPEFETIKNDNYNYRRYYAGYGLVSRKGKIKRASVNLANNIFYSNTNDYEWFELTSKYFSTVILPDDNNIKYKYTAIRMSGNTEEVSQSDNIYVTVPTEETSHSERFYIYCGPQLKKYLGSYYDISKNNWGLKNKNLDLATEGGSILGWLESVFKWALQLLYKFIHNYGVCIIILTLIIKIITWPLQQKSMNSAAQLSVLTPKVEEIKQKYPNNPQKQNMEMQNLYQQYGISPLGGCLPILILFLQFPILLAFYGLLNKHIELMGQPFIWWIKDLSVPETVATLSFNLPFLGNQLHLLPFLYVASSVFASLYSQKSNKNSQQKNMWFLTYGMPVLFLFLLYSAPSGIFVYWITQSLLSICQQFINNIKIKKKGGVELKKIKEREQPKAVIKYQERLKKLEELKKEQKRKK